MNATATWLWKKKMVLLALLLIGILVHMIYTKLVPAEAGFALILGPLVWLAEGHRQKQQHCETQRQLSAAKSEMRQHLLRSTGETVDKIRECKDAVCQRTENAVSDLQLQTAARLAHVHEQIIDARDAVSNHIDKSSNQFHERFDSFRKQIAERSTHPKRK
jgi:vacuolar-type H+-ATPase subunit E/Vma4